VKVVGEKLAVCVQGAQGRLTRGQAGCVLRRIRRPDRARIKASLVLLRIVKRSEGRYAATSS
jgi:hypothetical protein